MHVLVLFAHFSDFFFGSSGRVSNVVSESGCVSFLLQTASHRDYVATKPRDPWSRGDASPCSYLGTLTPRFEMALTSAFVPLDYFAVSI